METPIQPRFHELEHEAMRVAKTHSHFSERQGYEAGKVRLKGKEEREA